MQELYGNDLRVYSAYGRRYKLLGITDGLLAITRTIRKISKNWKMLYGGNGPIYNFYSQSYSTGRKLRAPYSIKDLCV